MKKIYPFVISILLLGVYSCKTTEANYRSAYEAAKEKKEAETSDVEQKLLDQQNPRTMVVGSDTIPVRTFYIGYTRDGGADKDRSVVKGYCVTVGKFKQVFNARSMRQRLIDNGYPGAFVVHDNMKDYYVIATATNDSHQAAVDLERVRRDSSLVLKPPFPYILMPGHLHRR